MMLFTTLPYAAFFLAVFVVHWVLPRPLRRPWLLVASYVFYLQAIPQYGLLIAAMTLVNYGFGLALGIGRNQSRPNEDQTPQAAAGSAKPLSIRRWGGVGEGPSPRRLILILAITANLATLAFFKYAALLLDVLWPLAKIAAGNQPEPLLMILLPLGISFFTFEFIHYVVEVYRGQPPMRNLIDFALFAAFFPTQIAGPIKRFPDWMKQIHQPVRLREIQADAALGLILRGVAKKIIIADLLAPMVAVGFTRPDRLGFLATWFVIYAFAAQIYADFSGYTDIGRGCAMLLGYSVPENFNRPYQARDPAEFWERWHISLSRWLRDYLFIPLGGSRVAAWRVSVNLLITMALGGLWHGASWHFLVWGFYQGALLVGFRWWARGVARVPRLQRALATRHGVLLGRVVTFQLVCLGWAIFRATTGPLAWTLFTAALHPARHSFAAGFPTLLPGFASLSAFVMLGAALTVTGGWLADWLRWQHAARHWVAWRARFEPLARPALNLALLLLIAIWPQGTAQRFIYFQF